MLRLIALVLTALAFAAVIAPDVRQALAWVLAFSAWRCSATWPAARWRKSAAEVHSHQGLVPDIALQGTLGCP